MKIKLFVLTTLVLLLSGCMPQAERFARMTPEQIHQWSDEDLCTNGYRKNPSIKAELLNRKLVTEQEFEYVFLSNEHNNFPAKGMRKCAMWTFSNWRELISEATLPDGTIREVWKIHHGEFFVSPSVGGHFFRVTIDNDRITNVSEPLEK